MTLNIIVLFIEQLKIENNSTYFYQLSIMLAPNKNIRDKRHLEKLINFLKSPDDCSDSNSKKYDTLYALIDDDGDLNCNNRINLHNLIYLDRYSRENYVLDPINIFIYLRNKHPNSKIVLEIEKELKGSFDFKNHNIEERLKISPSVLLYFKNLILMQYFDYTYGNNVKPNYFQFNEWKIELNYPQVFTEKNKKKKFLLFRNLFSIFNFDKLGLNKENDPLKFYFTCKWYSRLLKQHITDELK